MIKFFVIPAFFFFSLSLLAQPGNDPQDTLTGIPNQLDAYLLSAVKAYKFNGVALVSKNGTVIFHKAYGLKNVAQQTPNDTSTKFPILSITKSFTAITLLKLQEQGKVSLKDPLNKYLPDYPQGDKITLEQLLTHSSGIFNYTDVIDENDSALVSHPVTKQQVLDIFANKPLAFKPGKGFSYNNSAYFLAGLVIEKVTGKPYEQNVRELIFEPLGMTHSGFDFINLPADVKATGYQFLNDTQQKVYPFLDSTVSYAAGAIYSTTSDMFKWAQAIATGQLLSAATWKEAFTRKNGNYGYGFQLGDYLGNEFIKHSGGYPGYVSEYIYYPKEAVTIILLKNSGNYGQDLWPVIMGLSNIMFGKPYDLWQPRVEVKLSESVLKQKEGTYAVKKTRVSFFVKEGQLFVTMQDGSHMPLLAQDENVFYFENFNTQFKFEKGADGTLEKVIIHEHGKDYAFKKVK